MSATERLKEKVQLPDDSGVLMSQHLQSATTATSRERVTTSSAGTYKRACCGKPSVSDAPFVCNSCGAIKNCNILQDEGEILNNSDVEGSSDEFIQRIFSTSNIDASINKESDRERNYIVGIFDKISNLVLDIYKGTFLLYSFFLYREVKYVFLL